MPMGGLRPSPLREGIADNRNVNALKSDGEGPATLPVQPFGLSGTLAYSRIS